MDTIEILTLVNDLRERIAATRRQQTGMWPSMEYASVDDVQRTADARQLGLVIHRWEREIETLALHVSTPTPEWPGGWLLGSTAGDRSTAWITPCDLDHWATDPVWRDRAAAEAALEQLHRDAPGLLPASRPLPGYTPAWPESWKPPAAQDDTDAYRVLWVGATRGHIITGPGGGTTACETPLDLIGWSGFNTRPISAVHRP